MLATTTENSTRGNPSKKRGLPPATIWTPRSLISPALAALRPLIDDREMMRTGVGDAQICNALEPLMGHFNVSDAVHVSALIVSAQATTLGTENSALSSVWFMLRKFICCARGASPACAVARAAYFADERDGMSPACRATVAHAFQGDILSFSLGGWDGWLFGGRDDKRDSDFDEQPWWEHRAEMLQLDGIVTIGDGALD